MMTDLCTTWECALDHKDLCNALWLLGSIKAIQLFTQWHLSGAPVQEDLSPRLHALQAIAIFSLSTKKLAIRGRCWRIHNLPQAVPWTFWGYHADPELSLQPARSCQHVAGDICCTRKGRNGHILNPNFPLGSERSQSQRARSYNCLHRAVLPIP